ncbi:hypothetical protein BBJ28_00004196 [Nothophytophthora sp. Chile5]|nr:hypothetical protein BBJ28_00004196 [Nothophytophthora sp. Chile5]
MAGDSSAVYLPIESPNGSKTESLATATSDPPTFVLAWQNVTMAVGASLNTRRGQNSPPAREKTILSDVSGFARPGELLVLMGPSGAGKTSLLDCISGRNLAASGSVTVNGVPWTSSMKQLMTYVVQDDLFYETLTVREHLLFQARLRLGGNKATSSREEIERRVDKAMREFGLVKLATSLIGGVRVRGISGGERKRLSLAAEVLGDPAIFFVDEPTSGLDSFMAETVVTQLQRIARQGKTVLATIHQPSSELFMLFDQLYLLAAGAVVYHGPAKEAVAYFSTLGYTCPAFLNPADYFIRQLAVLDKEEDQAGMQRVQMLIDSWREFSSTAAYEATRPDAATSTAVEPLLADAEERCLGGFAQTLVLSQRNTVRLVRDKLLFRVSIMQSLMSAVIVGLVYLQLELGQTGIQNFVGVFFFIVVSQTMITANAQFGAVPLELTLVAREYQSGLYHVASWYAAKNVSELPMQILLPVVFFVPVYFMVGINHGALVYIYQQIFVMLVNSTAVGFGYMISCVCRRADIAPVIGIAVLMPMLLLGGLLINSSDIPAYLVWLEFLSPIKYGYEGLMKVFWGRIDSISCSSSASSCTAETGKQVLANFSMQSRSAMGDGLLLLVLSAGFRFVGFLALLWNLKRNSH